MARQQGHGLNERFDDKEIFLVFRIGKLEAIAKLGYTMLNLDTGVDLHEEVTVAVNDTLEGRG